MAEETDLSRERKWSHEVRAGVVIKNLERRNVKGQYVLSRQEAVSAVMDMVPPGAIVGQGDSLTLLELGIVPELAARNQNRLINPFAKGADGLFPDAARRRALQREALLSDVFLTGTNAITLDGKLVNIDGAGNRVAAMIFGPKKVIVVAGMNKVVKDVDEALDRVHGVCAPLNSMRHCLKHGDAEFGELPCVKTGKCTDCRHERRICRYTVIIEGEMPNEKDRINVVLVGEQLGI